ncbi:MAG: Gfo/Idh/MocA family oxidoreductase [Chloroflexi bacterium]|nr:Gfo/Idh/MocA family oxidoreductase [Chloroflexota bacterium]
MPGDKVRFAIIGLDHNHAYNHARLLLNAGAELSAVYSDEPDDVAAFQKMYPDCPVKSMAAILEDRSIDIVGGSAKPADRAAISVKAMQHGKDVVADKPAVIDLDQLAEIERVQRESGRLWRFYSNEHWDRRCTIKAGELVAQGAIGRVVQTTGFGPHTPRMPTRPRWFTDHKVSGGIIGDIGAHQIEQFLFFTGSRTASIVTSATGNFGHPDYPEFEDYGEATLEGDGGVGWFRVDWHSPESIRVPGDIRLFLLGTEGYMEMRKYIDVAGPEGTEHLYVVNKDGARLIDTREVQLDFGARLLADVRNRTETSITQERSFLITRLATEAQLRARRVGGPVLAAAGPQGQSLA